MKISLRHGILVFLFFVIILLVSVTTSAQNSLNDISVGSYAELLDALYAAPTDGTGYIIKITDNITLADQLEIKGGKSITITSDMTQSGSPFTLTQTATTTAIATYRGARHFYLMTGAYLTLENVILSGIGVASGLNGGVYVSDNASLIIKDGAAIENCSGGSFGGGVFANVYSTFIMNGGTIRNNKAESGGGVYAVFATLTMTAGEISGNVAISSGAGTSSYGGGLCLSACRFTVGEAGGSNDSILIMNNTADYMGGGVHVFTSTGLMYCGTVRGNKAMSGDELTYGGGIELYGGSMLTMKDGIISDNTANDFSGGVEVYDRSKFTMDGGYIINNTAKRGGGISVGYNSATFDMNGGIIGGTGTGNKATDFGGGVYVYSSGVMTVTSGIITDNNALYGGGIFTDDTGTVKVDNCTITDNASIAGDGGGGGIYTEDITYANLTTGDSTIFDGNSAMTTYTPAGDLSTAYPNIRYAAATAPFAHPLNNFDINTTFGLPLACHITFDSQGGSGIPDQFRNFGETVDRPLDPTKSGYTFYGWWTKDANGEWDYKWDFNTVLVWETHGTELVLFARWTEPTVIVSGTVSGLSDNSEITIVYSTDDGASTNSTVTDNGGNYSFTVAYGANVAITPPALPEYSVNPKSITIENLSEDSANNDFNYTPNTYIPKTYTVIYNPNDGQGTAHAITEAVGTNHTVLNNTSTNLGFTKSNYAFNGWNTQTDGNGAAYNPEDTLVALAADESVILYAMWEELDNTEDTDTTTSSTESNGTSPQTGDSAYMVFWYAAALPALLVMVLLIGRQVGSRKSL